MCSLLDVRHGLLVDLQVSFKKVCSFLKWISECVNALMIGRGTRYLCCWFVIDVFVRGLFRNYEGAFLHSCILCLLAFMKVLCSLSIARRKFQVNVGDLE